MSNIFLTAYKVPMGILKDPPGDTENVVDSAASTVHSKYNTALASAKTFLSSFDERHKTEFINLLDYLIYFDMPKDGDHAIIRAVDIRDDVGQNIGRARVNAINNVTTHDLGVTIQNLSKQIWTAKSNEIISVLTRIKTAIGYPGKILNKAFFDYDVFRNIVFLVHHIYIRRVIKRDGNDREWTAKVAKLGTEMLENVIRISECSYRDNENPVVLAWVLSSYIKNVHPTLAKIADIVSNPKAAETVISKYLSEMHNEKGFMNLNDRLHQYVSDLIATSGKPMATPLPTYFNPLDVGTLNKTPFETVRHYANDLFLLYRLIVRDVILFRLRAETNEFSKTNKSYTEFEKSWNATQYKTTRGLMKNLPTVAIFLHDLFFINLEPPMVGNQFETARAVRATVTSWPSVIQDCLLKNVLGDKYRDFLKEAAKDCIGPQENAQVRIETLLKYIVRDAMLTNRSNVKDAAVGNIYNDTVRILDIVAKHLKTMSPMIVSAFSLLNSTIKSDRRFISDRSNAGSVLTFVVIRNDYGNDGNRRFKITVDNVAEPSSMMIKYEWQPHMLYGPFRIRERRKRNPVDKLVMSQPIYTSELATTIARGGGDLETAKNNLIQFGFKDWKDARLLEELNRYNDQIDVRIQQLKLVYTKQNKTYTPNPRDSYITNKADKDKYNALVEWHTAFVKRGEAIKAKQERERIAKEQQLIAQQAKQKIADEKRNRIAEEAKQQRMAEEQRRMAEEQRRNAENAAIDAYRHKMQYLAGMHPNEVDSFENGERDDSISGAYDVPLGEQRNYVFGPFTRIFGKPKSGNDQAKDISNSQIITDTIIERIKNGKDVCIFGYGQSGAGKTSLLIYHNDVENNIGKPGIISHICHKLTASFDILQCRISEIGIQSGSEATIDDNNQFYGNEKYTPQTFTKRGDEWGLGNKVQDVGQYIYDETEKNRLTRATTNNPTSSRTHVIIFLKFIQNDKTSHLVICDFAGVENTFRCDKPQVKKAFANIPLKPGVLAYQTQINALYNAHVAKLLSGTKFEKITYGELKNMENDMRQDTKSIEFQQYAEDKLKMSQTDLFDASVLKHAITILVDMYSSYETVLTTEIPLASASESDPNNKKLWGNNIGKMFYKLYSDDVGKDIMKTITGITHIVATKGEVSPKQVEIKNALFAILETYRPSIAANALKAKMDYKNGYSRLDQLLFELLIRTPQLLMGPICEQRVIEGSYINQSLDGFRSFLNDTLNRRGESPNANSECIAMQCNPFYMDCFGSMFNDPQMPGAKQVPNVGLVESAIIKELKNIDNLTFCLFNVINISKDKSFSTSTCNDPPPVPFIDASRVIFEYNRVISVLMRGNPASEPSHDISINNITKDRIFNMGVLKELQIATIKHCDDQIYALNFNPNSEELSAAAVNAKETKDNIIAAINNAIVRKPIEMNVNDLYNSQSTLLEAVREVINVVERNNASTLMGTMMFSDSIAKFGSNRTPCSTQSTYLENTMLTNVSDLFESLGKGIPHSLTKNT